MKLFISLHIFCVTFHLSVACDKGLYDTENVMTMISSIKNQSKNFEFQCDESGIDCASFSCDVSLKNDTSILFSMNGSWYCSKNDTELSFEITHSIGTTIKLFTSSHSNHSFTMEAVELTIKVLFGNQNGALRNLTLNLTVKHKKKAVLTDNISTKLQNIKILCNCTNINSLEIQIKQNPWLKNVRCWSLNLQCLSFFCIVTMEQPLMIHYTFNGSLSCPNGLPEYDLFQGIHNKMSQMNPLVHLVHSFFNSSDAVSSFNQIFSGKKEEELSVFIRSTFTSISNDSLTLLSNYKASLSGISVDEIITINFPNPGCKVQAITLSPTSSSPANSSSMSSSIEPSTSISESTLYIVSTHNNSTLTEPTDIESSTLFLETSISESTSIESSAIEPSASLIASVSVNITAKITNASHSSNPAKTVLIILAVLIILSVLLVALYLKKKPRLSNQPAYYNDIALNDPLRYEIEGEQQDDDDDDELPLFS